MAMDTPGSLSVRALTPLLPIAALTRESTGLRTSYDFPKEHIRGV